MYLGALSLSGNVTYTTFLLVSNLQLRNPRLREETCLRYYSTEEAEVGLQFTAV